MAQLSSDLRKKPRDLSYLAHRQLIGWLGILLPLLVIVISILFPSPDLSPEMLDSISSYYYTSANTVFVGSLYALALFLCTYGGYEGDLADRVLGKIAGVAAMGVAFFPTSPPDHIAAPLWWSEWMKTTHYLSALVLFLSFIAFAVWIFRRTSATDKKSIPVEKRRRNNFFMACGIVMIVCVSWVGVALKLDKPIFLPEAFALIAFAVSWLVKGYAHKPVVVAIHKISDLIKK